MATVRVVKQYADVARLVRPGEWTTYGDISAAAHEGTKGMARRVAHAAATDPGFSNAHRVLGHDGRVIRGPDDDREARRAVSRLRTEGVEFTHSGHADPSQRIHWDELRRRMGLRASRRHHG